MLQKIKSIKKLENKPTRYDITVSTTGNFYANNILVHNSSVRLANQQMATYPNWLYKLLRSKWWNSRPVQFLEKKFRRMVWTPIAGSRRVLKLKDNDTQSYYEEDIYNKALSSITHIIPKSWVIYGELIGWAGEKPIQPKYTYNVPKGDAHLYVYRIAIVNEDGLSCDLSFDQMAKWCSENGLKICPEIWRGPKRLFDANGYMDVSYHKLGMSQCIPLSPDSPCDEGVVVRIEGGLTPNFYKCKSPNFLIVESNQLDKGVANIEDEIQ